MLRYTLLFCAIGTAATAQEATPAHFYFREDFTGEAISPELEILNRDPERMALVEGEHLLVVTHREIRNVVSYDGPLPENFSVVVRFEDAPPRNYQYVGVDVGEEGRAVSILFGGDYCHFVKELGEEKSRYESYASLSAPIYLTLVKSGIKISGSCSNSPTGSEPIGEHVVIGLTGPVRVRAYNSEANAPESPIRIDWIEIQ